MSGKTKPPQRKKRALGNTSGDENRQKEEEADRKKRAYDRELKTWSRRSKTVKEKFSAAVGTARRDVPLPHGLFEQVEESYFCYNKKTEERGSFLTTGQYFFTKKDKKKDDSEQLLSVCYFPPRDKRPSIPKDVIGVVNLSKEYVGDLAGAVFDKPEHRHEITQVPGTGPYHILSFFNTAGKPVGCVIWDEVVYGNVFIHFIKSEGFGRYLLAIVKKLAPKAIGLEVGNCLDKESWSDRKERKAWANATKVYVRSGFKVALKVTDIPVDLQRKKSRLSHSYVFMYIKKAATGTAG